MLVWLQGCLCGKTFALRLRPGYSIFVVLVLFDSCLNAWFYVPAMTAWAVVVLC